MDDGIAGVAYGCRGGQLADHVARVDVAPIFSSHAEPRTPVAPSSRLRITDKPDTTDTHRIIDASIQPLTAELDIHAEISRLVATNDVSALAAMYEGYTQTFDILYALSGQPWADGADDFIRTEAERMMSKAYLVADAMQTTRAPSHRDEDLCRTLFDCALRMGNTTADALTVTQLAHSRGAI